ncbi:MAG TPA: TfoX/Sxy family protein [Kofleriaceae bacterium]|jgi:TfoX/Sxy family transcriptional regulator of competence genes|nr:TfoX/Sxy family protein [Kofleriaceae bacterium]
MAWIKVPPEHHPVFRAALPRDPRVETQQMFGGVAAKVNGHLFAGLFGRSAIVLLGEAERAEALALDGASLFDPMGDGRARSDKVMLPEDVFHDPDELRRWIARAFDHCAALPRKTKSAARKPAAAAKPPARAATRKPSAAAKKSPTRSAKSPPRPVKRTSPASKPAARRAGRGRK